MKKTPAKKPARAAQAGRTKSKTARVAAKTKSSKKNKLTIPKLRLFNIIAGLLLAAQAAALLLLSDQQKGDALLSGTYLTPDPVAASQAGQTFLAPALSRLMDINLAHVAAAVLIAAAVASLLSATRLHRVYEAEVNSGTNKYRWLSYIFTLGLLSIAAAMLVGVYDIASLLMIFSFTAIACVAALYAERLRPAPGWLTKVAAISALLPIAVIGIYILLAHLYGGGLPLDRLAVAGVLALGLLVSVLAIKNAHRTAGTPTKYLAVERTYQIFAFLVPTVFAWALFSLVLK